MSVRVNVRMSKIMRTPIKGGVRTYATYANCRTHFFEFARIRLILEVKYGGDPLSDVSHQ